MLLENSVLVVSNLLQITLCSCFGDWKYMFITRARALDLLAGKGYHSGPQLDSIEDLMEMK